MTYAENGQERILVCGGRDYTDKDTVYRELDKRWNQWVVIVHGDAKGADKLADEWARERNVPVMRYPAKWKLYGRGAGPIRNKEMLEKSKPDSVVAFPGGSGTDNMVNLAEDADVRVERVC